MDVVSDATGIWKHGALIIWTLGFLFLVSIGVDVVLWYSMQKNNTAAKTLNEIIAAQPQAPKTDEDKTKLLDSLAAAHAAALQQVKNTSASSSSATATSQAKSPNSPSTNGPSISNDEKIKLLNALH